MENAIIAKYTKMIMTAMKAGNKSESGVYKLIKAKMMEFTTQKNAPVLDEAAEVNVLRKMLKERQDTAKIYTDAGRTELAEKENLEASVIETLLPKAASVGDINNAIMKYVEENGDFDQKKMGIVVKYVKAALPTAEGSMVAAQIKAYLNPQA